MTVAEARAWLQARAASYGRDAGILRRDGDSADALLYEAIRDELRECVSLLDAKDDLARIDRQDAEVPAVSLPAEVRCCKGCPDCMGIGSREQIKAMLADIRKVIALCEKFETTGRLGALTGYAHSTQVRDLLERYRA